MNERIRELAEQAGFQYINEEGIGWAGNHNASLPKFSELIVRECADVTHRLIVEDGKEFPMKSVAYRLKEHFGVE